MISRRAALGGCTATIALALCPASVEARARTPYGGRLALHVPWPVTSIDPHRIDDATAALFGDALFDALYARGDAGEIVPSLAESDPEPAGSTLA